jgi:MoaA/NifB/PqqE/SkfB family radical SAM enzyme
VAVTCALGADNALQATSLLERARDLGVDRVGFLPLHDFSGNRVGAAGPPAAFPLAARSGADGLVDNSREYLELFERAYAGARNPVPCAAPRTSLVVDCYGDVYPCVPLNATREKIPGNGDLQALWRSRAYTAVRQRLAGCRACFWNCHTELNLALDRLGANR